MPSGATWTEPGVVCGYNHHGTTCNKLYQGKGAKGRFVAHLRMHATRDGVLPSRTELAKVGALVCTKCHIIALARKDGKMRAHDCAKMIKKRGLKGPAPKRARVANEAEAEAETGANKDDEEDEADDAEAEANGNEQAQAEHGGEPNPELVQAPPKMAGPPRFQTKALSIAFLCGLLAAAAGAATLEERDNKLEQFFTLPLSKIHRPLRGGEDGTDDMHGPNPVPVQAVGFSGWMTNALRALRELYDRQIGRAMRCLTSSGKADITKEEVQHNLRGKYPARPANVPQLQCPPTQPGAVPELALEAIINVIMGKAPKTAPGFGGWSYCDLQMILKAADKSNAPATVKAFPANLAWLVNLIAKGELDNDRIRPLLTSLRGVALVKAAGSDDSRPIGINSVFLAVTTGALKRHPEVIKMLAKLVSKRAFSHAVSGGAEAIPHIIRAMLASKPGAIALKIDIKNAFNSVDRQLVLEIIHKAPCLGPIIKMLYGHGPTLVDYSNGDVVLEILSVMGVTQGETLSMDLFDVVMTEVLKLIEADLPADSTLERFADDCYPMGPPAGAFSIYDKILIALKPTGMEIQPAKSLVYLPDTLPHEQAALAKALAEARGVKVVDGFVACGGLIGTQQFCEAKAAEIVADVCERVDRVVDVALSKEGGREISIQAALVLLRFCICPGALIHFVRTTPRRLLGDSLKTFDKTIANAVMRILAVPEIADQVKRENFVSRLQLDLVCGGAGLPSLEGLADPAFFASFALTASLAERVLPHNFNSDIAFPDAKRLLEGGILTDVSAFEQYKHTADFQSESVPKLQAVLTHTNRIKRQQLVLAKLDKQGKADVLSRSSAEASSWLTAIPGKDPTLILSNDATKISWKMLLGLDATQIVSRHEPGHAVVCRACAPAPAGAQAAAVPVLEEIRKSAIITNDSGSHIFSCAGGGPGSVSGLIKGSRHHGVSNQLEAAYRRCAQRPGGHAPVKVSHEPPMELHADGMEGVAKPARNRADFALQYPDGRVDLVDTTVVLPAAGKFPKAATQAGHAADRRSKAKVAFYAKRWKLNPGTSIVAASIEAGGRWHPALLAHLKRFIKSAYPDDKKLFVYNLKASTQRVSVALHRATSEAVLVFNQVAKAYPAVPLGGVAAAPPDDAAEAAEGDDEEEDEEAE